MATTVSHVQASFKTDLETAFDALQEQRTAQLDAFREIQLAARVLLAAEARRLAAANDADDPRPAQFSAASGAVASRVAALDIEAQISVLRVAPAARLEPAGESA